MNLPYEVIVSDADETTEPGLSPAEIVEQLSHRKAQAVYERCIAETRFETGGVIVGSDTIVVLEDTVLGKPKDAADAFRMLQCLQGQTHHVYTGVAVIDIKTEERDNTAGRPLDKTETNETPMFLGETGQYHVAALSANGHPAAIVGHTVSQITFRPMSDEEIWAYINTGEPLDKAGSYGVQGIGSVFIERIEGDFYSVMGLPLNLLYPILAKFGISPFQLK
ncbi:hypothetical protein A8L34_21505 [Bacillus sp. FJAT-27264]|nr:hypothetical protein A8L34_21505 [Bacillus sp. FJAT-27264]